MTATYRNVEGPVREAFVFEIIGGDDGGVTPEIERLALGLRGVGSDLRIALHQTSGDYKLKPESQNQFGRATSAKRFFTFTNLALPARLRSGQAWPALTIAPGDGCGRVARHDAPELRLVDGSTPVDV
jgi:hypothetical protein